MQKIHNKMIDFSDYAFAGVHLRKTLRSGNIPISFEIKMKIH